jgi:conjugative transposon TraN protein
MKVLIIINVLILNVCLCHAQNIYLNKLEVTNAKTTSIIFPTKIKSIDIGSPDIIAQRVDETENVLQVKASLSSFPETNLTVITDNGTLHQFDVNFCSAPKSCYFIIDNKGVIESVKSVSFDNERSSSFYNETYQLINTTQSTRQYQTKSSRIRAILKGIFIREGKVFMPLSIINDSYIPFDIQSVRFFIRDRKQAKRTAIQEIEIKPTQTSTKLAQVRENGSMNSIWVIDKLTLPKSKELIIEIIEKNGSRNINMKLKAKALNKAEPVKK